MARHGVNYRNWVMYGSSPKQERVAEFFYTYDEDLAALVNTIRRTGKLSIEDTILDTSDDTYELPSRGPWSDERRQAYWARRRGA
jgi:hypothetical protein